MARSALSVSEKIAGARSGGLAAVLFPDEHCQVRANL